MENHNDSVPENRQYARVNPRQTTQATKELWGKIFGTINTREKFLDNRLRLAQNEWKRLKENDSLECRNCHDFNYMDLTLQGARAADHHERLLGTKQQTCIDCHKGIAHRLPDMSKSIAP